MIEKHCKTCEVKFNAIKEAQFFCSRKCFKRDYYKRNKVRQALLAKARPIFNCGDCGHKEEVPFDPVKNYSKFNEYKCPKCKASRADMVDREKKKTPLELQIESCDMFIE